MSVSAPGWPGPDAHRSGGTDQGRSPSLSGGRPRRSRLPPARGGGARTDLPPGLLVSGLHAVGAPQPPAAAGGFVVLPGGHRAHLRHSPRFTTGLQRLAPARRSRFRRVVLGAFVPDFTHRPLPARPARSARVRGILKREHLEPVHPCTRAELMGRGRTGSRCLRWSRPAPGLRVAWRGAGAAVAAWPASAGVGGLLCAALRGAHVHDLLQLRPERSHLRTSTPP